MKIFRPHDVHFRVRFRMNNRESNKEQVAFTVIDTSMEELEALTDEVYTEELKRHKGEKYSSSVLMVTQRMLYGKKTGEFSRRLYRCDITIGQKLYDAIMKKETEK